MPPSATRALQKLNQMEVEESFIEPLKRLFKNKYYLLLCNSYGLSIGVLNVTGTLLNQIYLAHFEVSYFESTFVVISIIRVGTFNYSISENRIEGKQ